MGSANLTYPVPMLMKILENFDNSELQKIHLDAPGVKYAREIIKKDHIINSNMVGSIAGKFQEAMNKMTMDNSNSLINEMLKLNFDESHETMLKISEVVYNKVVDEPSNNHVYILIFIGTIHKKFKDKSLINYFINLAKNSFDQTFQYSLSELSDMYFEREMGDEITPIDKIVKKKGGLMRALTRMYLEKACVPYEIIYNCLVVLINKLSTLSKPIHYVTNSNSNEEPLHSDEDDERRCKCAISYLYGTMLYDLLDEGAKPHKLIKNSNGNVQLNGISLIKDIIVNQLQVTGIIDLIQLSSVKNNIKTILCDKYGIK